MSLDQRMATTLSARKDKGTFRSLKAYDRRQAASSAGGGSCASKKGKERAMDDGGMIDFSSNDYLSLTHSRLLHETYLARLHAHIRSSSSDDHSVVEHGLFGSTGSRLLDGTTPAHTSLERRLAGFFEYPSEAVSALSDGSSSERSWEEDFGNSSTDATSSQGHTSALLFNSGWDANVSYFSSVPRAGDWIVHDELVHASVWDGMRANERRGVRSDTRRAFKHNDVDDLSRTLLEIIETKPLGQIFIAIETLYSMDGDIAPLEDMCRILSLLQHRHPHVIHPDRVCVVVDEAHTTGVYGRQGRGLVHEVVERMGREGSEVLRWVQVRVMTFGKGVGSQGAVLLASAVTRAYLVNFARPFIFSTAMSVNNVYAIEAAFDVLQHPEAEARRQRLFRLCETLRDEVLALLEKRVPRRVLRLMNSPATTAITTLSGEASDQGRRRPSSATAILPLLTSHPHALAAHLQARGYLVRPVVPPTVPKGLERVRVCLHADNEESDVRKLVKVIGEWAQREIMQNSAKL